MDNDYKKRRPEVSTATGSGSFVLISDVSQFYPTLYTHAIPWALHGKAYAKANFPNTKG
jgi:hypothetical protein